MSSDLVLSKTELNSHFRKTISHGRVLHIGVAAVLFGRGLPWGLDHMVNILWSNHVSYLNNSIVLHWE